MAVQYTRVLKQGMSGDDVLYMKESLFALGYYSKSVSRVTHNTFSADTKKAVGYYQSKNKDKEGIPLVVDYKIGPKTWGAIVRDVANIGKTSVASKIEPLLAKDYPNISKERLALINEDLKRVDESRRNIVAECLKYAYDRKTNTKKVISLYVFGANLYQKDLSLHIAKSTYINERAIARPTYFNGGRKEWMLQQLAKNPKLPCSDCSGLEIGYMRKFGYIARKTDATADTLCSSGYSKAISKSNLLPGDWTGKPGHIATYVGGNLCVEFVGGAYGCQLTDVDDRIAYNYMTGKLDRMSSWTTFRRPTKY